MASAHPVNSLKIDTLKVVLVLRLLFLITFSVPLLGQSRRPAIAAVVNAASYANGSIAAGEIITLFGSDMGPSLLIPFIVDSQGNIPASLSGVQVLFDGAPMPLLYVSATQISAIAPLQLAGGATQIQVVSNGVASAAFPKQVDISSPGIFSIAATGKGQAAMTNSDGALNSATNPAAPGTYVTFYVTGASSAGSGAIDGAPAPGPAQMAQNVVVTIGGKSAQVLYAGAATGLVNGFSQVNALVPDGVSASGAVPLTFQINNTMSQSDITMYVSTQKSNAPATIFLIHGLGQGKQDVQALQGSLASVFGLDSGKFRVDGGFDFSECSNATSCAANCSMASGADKLGQYIIKANPPGDVILIGFSMGGVLARDVIASNRLASLSGRRVSTLITLGSPILGYPYSTFDRLRYCGGLVQDIDGNWRSRQASNTVVLSQYLDALKTKWAAGNFPGFGGVWLAASGRSCSTPARLISPSTGCRDKNPFSDGIVCDDSASYFGETANKPTALWQDPGQVYVHSNSTFGSLGSALILCGNNGQNPSLSNPPATGLLFDTIIKTLNGLPVTAQPENTQPATGVLSLSDSKQLLLFKEALHSDVLGPNADEAAMLLLNRSALVVPMLEARLKQPLTKQEFSQASEMLAYSGSEAALAAIGRLLELDESKFAPLVARVLDHNLANGGNPFLLMKSAKRTAKLWPYIQQWNAAQGGSPRIENLPK